MYIKYIMFIYVSKGFEQKLRNPANNFILKWLYTSKNIMKHETVNFEWAKILFREIQSTSTIM